MKICATLRADKVRFNTVTKDAWAEGNVRLNREGQEWVAPSIYYNFDTRALKTEDVRGFFAEHPVKQGAKQIEQHLERLRVAVACKERWRELLRS